MSLILRVGFLRAIDVIYDYILGLSSPASGGEVDDGQRISPANSRENPR